MTPIKILGIQGTGGLRMDFVAGWLGVLPNFISSNWNIDPLTRQSQGTTANVVNLGDPNSIDIFLESHRYTLDPSATLSFATKLHYFNPVYQPLLDNNSIDVFSIIYDRDDIDQVLWEYCIKTFGKLEYDKTWTVDRCIKKEIIVDQDRINYLETLLTTTKIPLNNKSVNFPGLEFSKLFCTGGSKYLCDVINISVADTYHQYWDHMVPLAQTPDTVCLWNKVWKKQDYLTNQVHM